ncbi:D-alanyl-D-alanine carboxypeptidase family protein [Microbacterium gubbeenense]|uniref:D-alanyl-D-alanine carboxypeptidase family protein n=1 Tax=Microbacterium gubbeenense TaxID=159896 RepID=UPI0012FC00E2|nr:D-alanyl-D-alanine carboxypeptidase family protein [Microbacterium gubbeenense]
MTFVGAEGSLLSRGTVRASWIRRMLSGIAAAVVLAGLAVVVPQSGAVADADLAASEVVADAGADPSSSRPIYRFWGAGYGNAHFYTLDHSEAQNLHRADGWWAYEGTDFRVWPLSSDTCVSGTDPVYRFWSPGFTSHFYTMDSAEADRVRRDNNWHYEGVRFCALSAPANGAVEVHRFWSSEYNKHFYTANASEAQDLRANDRSWSYEGVAMYAPTSGAASAPVTGTAAPRLGCQSPEMSSAVASHDAARITRLFGGAGVLRSAIADGRASCVPLRDPALPWVMVNKRYSVSPADYVPPSLTVPSGSLVDGGLRGDAIGSYEQMQRDVAASGAGSIALTSGYRSYNTQAAIHRSQVGSLGVVEGERLAARPGHSEHQLGLAADVVACGSGGCGSMYAFAGTAQERWVRENSWRYGWIVRYEAGRTGTTGYNPEPWHLRYIGADLAREYHDGGYHTLEQFFGLPAAPAYR